MHNWKTERKTFSFNVYGGEELARKAAILYREKRSLEIGKTRNQYRILRDEDGTEYAEVDVIKCKETVYMKVDLDDIPVVERCTWISGANGYAFTSTWPGMKGTTTLFHRCVCPGITDDLQVDHINR